jgi:hypothetical protein
MPDTNECVQAGIKEIKSDEVCFKKSPRRSRGRGRIV